MTHADVASVDGLQQAVDGLAARLGRSVAVDDSQGRLVVASRHFGDEDPLRTYAVMQRDSDPRVMAHFGAHDIYRWTVPGRIPANPELGFKARVCCPIRAHGIPFGHLFLIDDGIGADEIELAAAVADDLGRLLHRRLVLHDRDHGRRAEVARDLVGDDPVTRAAARRRLSDEQLVETSDPVVALSVLLTADEAPDTTLRIALERLERSPRGAHALTTVTGRQATVLVFGDRATTDTGRALAALLVADLAGARAVVGVGVPASGPDAAHESAVTARRAAEAAELLPHLGGVAAHDDLGVYAVLLALPPAARTADRLPSGLRRLLTQDAKDSLVDTLETYLDCCGDATRTAGALSIHRSTLYYRLGRIETIAGVDLHDGEQRLALHLGIKLRRLITTQGHDGG
ncbi:PucR family transcriptional regulator [Actinomycetospora termitidis]|uniref:Helix-turn-helix domain-containing protein n=1 Tax=Actinomycetospora termitidis TaxID=3053470 RepID=A0ABT7MGJ9_9PSEU|nr:helix-turn-helix domain-containing protein [Actinomycetospora sp. Odt1-22]MDL5159801.1 helix-turn-helix domain-containing protein [Actinomycetospora sp. Odt1-22]